MGSSPERHEVKPTLLLDFDGLWQRGIKRGRKKNEVRNKAYEWLSKKIGINKKHTHIGMFDIDLCKKVIEICKPYYNEK